MRPKHFSLAVAAVLLVLGLGAMEASAGRDRTPPTTPTGFRVSAVTSYSASLVWSASSDDSGSVRYEIRANTGESVTVSGTSFVWRSGLTAGYSYTFTIRALDEAGNASKMVTAAATLPSDRTAPSAPTLSVSAVGPTHANLSWTAAVDDGPYVSYVVIVDGASTGAGTATSHTVTGLSPSRSYTARVRAADMWGNASVSNEVSISTPAQSGGDLTGPTAPADFGDRGMTFADGETWLFWEASSDDVTPPELISYRVLVNGGLDHTIVGQTQTVVYLPIGQTSTIDLVAVDESGNASTAARFTVVVP